MGIGKGTGSIDATGGVCSKQCERRCDWWGLEQVVRAKVQVVGFGASGSERKMQMVGFGASGSEYRCKWWGRSR